MNEDFVSFDLAKKLEEKGFEWDCYTTFDGVGYTTNFCPTISQVLKWLRKTHKLFLSPCVIADYQDDFHPDATYWSFIVVNIESGDSIYKEYERVTEKRYETFEEAAIAGIEYVLDILI